MKNIIVVTGAYGEECYMVEPNIFPQLKIWVPPLPIHYGGGIFLNLNHRDMCPAPWLSYNIVRKLRTGSSIKFWKE